MKINVKQFFTVKKGYKDRIRLLNKDTCCWSEAIAAALSIRMVPSSSTYSSIVTPSCSAMSVLASSSISSRRPDIIDSMCCLCANVKSSSYDSIKSIAPSDVSLLALGNDLSEAKLSDAAREMGCATTTSFGVCCEATLDVSIWDTDLRVACIDTFLGEAVVVDFLGSAGFGPSACFAAIVG